MLANTIRASRNTIFFIDEGLQGLLATKLSNLIRGSDNYFVIVGRDKIGTISYSYKSVMQFVSRIDGVLTLELLSKLKDDMMLLSSVKSDTVILPEDKKAGYELINHGAVDRMTLF